MNKICNQVQEKISCSIHFELSEQHHLADCSACQNVFADYQSLSLLLNEDFENTEIPADFADKVMVSIEKSQNQLDWFESFGQRVSRLLEIPAFHYGSLITGFGIGIVTFIRFVAYIFIPA